MQLGGTWRAIAADESLRRVFPDPALDDGGWAELTVPHHWQSEDAFATCDGPMLYRRRFDTPRVAAETRSWLQLDGLFYQGDVWLDGSYVGDTEGYFFPHSFEITEGVRDRTEHVLAIEVACNPPADLTAKLNLTGVFQHWDCFDQDWNPGGIWRPVWIRHTGPVKITRLRVLCLEATADRAVVELRVGLDAKTAGQVSVTTRIERHGTGAGADRNDEHQLAAGPNEVCWRVPIETPDLWWPHALGPQPLYDVAIDVTSNGAISDRGSLRTGLRQFRMKNFVAAVNGERLFLKGTNQGPTKRALGEATPQELERDVVMARGAGLDLMRVHGHISRPELYDAADRHGLLLWQDLPLQWGYTGVRRQAVRQAVEAVDLLGHHPSVALWCGHNEPFAVVPAPGSGIRALSRFAAAQVLPTWNKTVLDRSIQRALEKADASRPVVAHSGVLPHPAWGTDSHLYFGWYHGRDRELAGALAKVPVLARFVSEFGAQAVPTDADFCQPQRWPDLDWEKLRRAHGLQKVCFERYVPPADYQTFEAWRDATQEYQAELIRHHIETLRRLKYRPAGGFCQFCFGDGQPAVTWSVLDHERRPKAGFAALAAACAPVIVVADRPAAVYHPGGSIDLNVHVVSDLRVPIADGRVIAELRWPGGGQAWSFEGSVEADGCARVGTIRLVAPDVAGELVVELELIWPGGTARNRYRSRILSK